MTLTPRLARIKLYDHPVIGPHLGIYGTTTNVSTTAITDPVRLGAGSYGPNAFKGQATIILPSENGNAREKDAGALAAGGVLSHNMGSGNNWSGAVPAASPYEILWGSGKRKVQFNHLVEAGRLAMRHVYFRYVAPIGPWKDSTGRDNSDFSQGIDWTASGGSLLVSASQDPGNNIVGFNSMLLANTSGADRYVYNNYGFAVYPGQTWYLAALLKVIAGSGTVVISWWDATATIAGATQIMETRSFVGPGLEAELGQKITIPAGCYKVQMRITLPTGMTVAVDSLPGHDLEASWLPTPDYVKHSYHLGDVQEWWYAREVATGAYLLQGRRPERWRFGVDYDLDPSEENQRPSHVQVLTGPGRRADWGLPSRSLWIDSLRQESDRTDFVGESSSYDGDEDLFMAAYRYEVAWMLEGRDNLGPSGRWARLAAQELVTLDAQRLVKQRSSLVQAVAVKHRRTAL